MVISVFLPKIPSVPLFMRSGYEGSRIGGLGAAPLCAEFHEVNGHVVTNTTNERVCSVVDK